MHLTIVSRICLIVGITCMLSACYYDVESELYPTTNCDIPLQITWASNAQALVVTHCAQGGCHVPGGTGPGDFRTYAAVKSKILDGKFAERVFDAKNMPPAAPLPVCDFQLLKAWVDQGAPEN